MQTQLLSVWGTIGSVVLAIFILLAMITVHEFGHYLAGKLLKFKIDEFSIGFGPALFKRRRKKSGELFAVRLFPLGGYCSFHGEDGAEDGEKDGADPPAQGPVFEEEIKGETQAERAETLIVTETSTETPVETPAEAPEIPAEIPAETPAKPAAKPAKRDWNDDGSFTHMKPWKRLLVLVAGAFMNYLLALLLIVVCLAAYGQSLVEFSGVAQDEEFPAEYSLRAGDILLKADGRNLYLTTDIARAVNGRSKGDIVKFTVSRLGENGERSLEEVSVMMRGDVNVQNSTDFTGVWGALGADIETREDGRYYTVQSVSYRFGFFETLGRSFVYSFKIAGSIFRVIGELFTGRLGLNALGGPVTTIRTTASVAAQSFRSFLEIAGFIGVNLAVFNLLPIPALDGSKVVFTVIEWVRGRPISRKVEAVFHAIGFVFLIGFAILVDILQFV